MLRVPYLAALATFSFTPIYSKSLALGTLAIDISVPVTQSQFENIRQQQQRVFSWQLPALQQALWADSHAGAGKQSLLDQVVWDFETTTHIGKRGWKPPEIDDPKVRALITAPCDDCRPKDETVYPKLELTKDFLSSTWLMEKMIDKNEEKNCIFYSQRRQRYVGPNPSLSTLVKEWAFTEGCGKVRCLWDLWPANQNPGTCAKPYEDYYCLWDGTPKCCWLNGLWTGMDDPQDRKEIQTRYFERMSKAFARSCKGDVYIVSELEVPELTKTLVNNIDRSIWISHELPTLAKSYKEGRVSKIYKIPVDGEVIAPLKDKIDITEAVFGSKNIRPYEETEARHRKRQKHAFATDERAIVAREPEWLQIPRQIDDTHNRTYSHVKRGMGCNPGADEPYGKDYFG